MHVLVVVAVVVCRGSRFLIRQSTESQEDATAETDITKRETSERQKESRTPLSDEGRCASIIIIILS
jgi:hypothetical protein